MMDGLLRHLLGPEGKDLRDQVCVCLNARARVRVLALYRGLSSCCCWCVYVWARACASSGYPNCLVTAACILPN